MMGMIEWLNRLISTLENAGVSSGDVAIAISSVQERILLKELAELTGLYHRTCHHAEFNGWRIIVKGAKE